MKSMKPFPDTVHELPGISSGATTRRSWLERIGLGALLASVAGMGAAMVRTLMPNVLYEPSQRFKAGLPEQFSEGATFLEDQRVSLGVGSATKIGPDLSIAYADVQSRFGRTLDDFLHNPTGTMAVVLSTQIHLTDEERNEAIRTLTAAYQKKQAQKAQETGAKR